MMKERFPASTLCLHIHAFAQMCEHAYTQAHLTHKHEKEKKDQKNLRKRQQEPNPTLEFT